MTAHSGPQSEVQRPALLLVRVAPPYAEELRRWAGLRDLACVAASEVPAPGDVPAALSLCVIGEGPGHSAGEARVRELRRRADGAPIVAIGSGLGVDAAVHLMRAGASDVIALPAAAGRVAARAFQQARRPGAIEAAGELVGGSAPMQRVRRDIAAVARTDTTVLITGETGVGKSIVAREIHRQSERRERRFVHVDCAALAATLIESELFGHERGAFTGAAGAREGRFELADGGTLFLDEIGDLDVALQAKLLRVLEEREYERVGGTHTRAMTARVVAATNRALGRAVAEGRFRPDLLFRLSVYAIEVPPLRERPEDIPELVRSGARRVAARLGLEVPAASRALEERLRRHPWPGNVRELMNLLERLALRRAAGEPDERALDGCLAPADRVAGGPGEAPPRRWIRASRAERELIAEALERERGNVSRAAHRLGLPRSTLRYRMQLHGLA